MMKTQTLAVQPTTIMPETTKSQWLESPVSNAFIHLNQRIGYWLSRWLGHALVIKSRSELTAADIKPRIHYVLAANHQSRIDPFIISGQIPFGTYKKLGTFRYFAMNGLFKNALLRPFVVAFGCFPTKPHPRYQHGLEYSTKLLHQGRSLLIFPEARRTIRGESTARPGVMKLAHEPNTMIIPAHIEWQRRGLLGRQFRLTVGQPFSGSGLSADEIMDCIYALKVT
jgi:1-acyl-sn-glycerol-3-phosphate acyltransferase